MIEKQLKAHDLIPLATLYGILGKLKRTTFEDLETGKVKLGDLTITPELAFNVTQKELDAHSRHGGRN